MVPARHWGSLTGESCCNIKEITDSKGVQIQVVTNMALDLTEYPPHCFIPQSIMEYVKKSMQLCWNPASHPYPPTPTEGHDQAIQFSSHLCRWPSLYNSWSVCHQIWQYARFAQAFWQCNRPIFLWCMAILNLVKPPFLLVKDYWACLNVPAQITSHEITTQILNWLPVGHLKFHSQWDLSDYLRCRSKLASQGKDLLIGSYHHWIYCHLQPHPIPEHPPFFRDRCHTS